MRLCNAVVLLVLAVLTPIVPAHATEIAGKWGLGFAVGDIIDSRAETSIIRGRSASTAWILDIAAGGSTTGIDERTVGPDTLIAKSDRRNSFNVNIGPRLRRYARPQATFSPYVDLFAHGFAYQTDWGDDTSQSRGAEVGLDVGAEYFLKRWPLSAAVHTTVLQARYRHDKIMRVLYPSTIQGQTLDTFSGSAQFSPTVQFRAYF